LSSDPKSLVGRRIVVSLVELSKDFSKFYFKINFQVDKVDGNKAMTKLVGHECMRERVYRMVQRHGRRVDVVQDITTKDGVKIRVKTVFMLIKRVGKAKKDNSRKIAKDIVEKIVKESTFDELVSDIISGDLQHEIRKECNKVYPIGSIEIRKTEIAPEKKLAAA
jgi:ribosomal protein S3AE